MLDFIYFISSVFSVLLMSAIVIQFFVTSVHFEKYHRESFILHFLLEIQLDLMFIIHISYLSPSMYLLSLIDAIIVYLSFSNAFVHFEKYHRFLNLFRGRLISIFCHRLFLIYVYSYFISFIFSVFTVSDRCLLELFRYSCISKSTTDL